MNVLIWMLEHPMETWLWLFVSVVAVVMYLSHQETNR